MKPLFFIVPAIAAFIGMSAPAIAENVPDAKITFSGGSIAAGIGYTWGSGTLLFKEKSYAFTVEGLSVIDIGIAKIDGTGDVYNLKEVKDFPGTYVAAGVGATIAGGGTIAAMENEKGVIIHFRSTTAGLRLNVSASGIVIRLK
jgi:hypothetical protein